jgi:hypothetical protein
MLVVLVLRGLREGGERLLGFAVQQDNWVLHAGEPVFALAQDWRETFPDLAEEPGLEVWRQSWRNWCQPRALPAAEIDSCTLERHGMRLRITASPRLVESLRATRSDALKGEAWLQAGSGRLHALAQVEVVAAGSPGGSGKRDRITP